MESMAIWGGLDTEGHAICRMWPVAVNLVSAAAQHEDSAGQPVQCCARVQAAQHLAQDLCTCAAFMCGRYMRRHAG